MIEGRDITMRFGDVEVLSHVDIDVPYGKVLALCGPNGAGKSTLLSALAGDLSKMTGQVRYNEVELGDIPAYKLAQNRAVLEQSPSLSANFTVHELVALSIPIELPPTQVDTLIPTTLGELGLNMFADKLVAQLSGGQRHRAHLARVLAQLHANKILYGPGYLFLDEPTASLDVLHQIEVMKVARKAAKSGAGVLVVLHDLNLAAAFADQVVLMAAGSIASAGTVGEVFQNNTLSQVYGTPIIVEKPSNGTLFVHPDFRAA